MSRINNKFIIADQIGSHHLISGLREVVTHRSQNILIIVNRKDERFFGFVQRIINRKEYYYLQYRQGSKIIQKYIGKQKPDKLEKMIHTRRALSQQLNEVKESLKLLSKVNSKNA